VAQARRLQHKTNQDLSKLAEAAGIKPEYQHRHKRALALVAQATRLPQT